MDRLLEFLVFKKDKIIFLFCFLLFSFLIFKDPFSQRTLIPNFEPYPDTFYYINPSLNLIKGLEFKVSREGRVLKQHVPPLYSLVLLPSFVVNPDPRMSYYSNVLLSLISLLLFWLILKKLFKNQFIIFITLLLFATNYFIYWVPSLVMAENLTLTLYLAAIFYLLSQIEKTNLVILSTLAVGLYATKYANIPLTSVVIIITLGKIFSNKDALTKKFSLTSFFMILIGICFFALAIFESFTKGNNIFTQIFEHLFSIYKSVPKSKIEVESVSSSSWFSIQYISKNLPLYINSLLGVPNRFLWDNTPLVPKSVAIGGVIGIFWGLLTKNLKLISSTLVLFVLTSVLFMSTFYSFDARYIYIAIPSLLIGFGLLLKRIEEKFNMKRKNIFNLIIIISIFVYLSTSFIRIKSQISLNLKYAETPWNYVAVVKMNEYFTLDKVKENKKPILISALPPFLIDYFSNGNYTLLPLSYEQEFRGIKELVWGENDYSDLPKLYRKYLDLGFELYVSRAGLGNEGYTNRDFDIIVKEFDTEIVMPGCFEQCNIYKIRLK